MLLYIYIYIPGTWYVMPLPCSDKAQQKCLVRAIVVFFLPNDIISAVQPLSVLIHPTGYKFSNSVTDSSSSEIEELFFLFGKVTRSYVLFARKTCDVSKDKPIEQQL